VLEEELDVDGTCQLRSAVSSVEVNRIRDDLSAESARSAEVCQRVATHLPVVAYCCVWLVFEARLELKCVAC